MSSTARVITGLAAGMVAGLVLRGTAAAPALLSWIEPVGTIWVNAIRMVILPLILSLLIVGIVEAGDARRIGRLGILSLALFLTMLTTLAVLTAVSAPALYSLLELDPRATAELRASLPEAPAAVSAAASLREFVLSLVPANVVKAAADGAMLPFLVFTVIFALALTRLAPELRQPVHVFFRAVRDAMFVIIGWILAVAPIGVFALGFATTVRVGGQAFGAFGYYIGLLLVLHALTGAALYALAVGAGRVPLRVFARAVAPAQAVALSSRSSYASLPALIEGAQHTLRLPGDVTGFVLPFAVATFKLTSAIYWTLGALLVAQLYGIEMSTAAIATVAAASVLLNAATPGIPSGGLLIQAPVYMAAGLPVEGIGMLIAIDTIPDMFKTAFNVTADMTVAVLVARWTGTRAVVPAEQAPSVTAAGS